MIFLSPGMSYPKDAALMADKEKIRLSFSQFLSEEVISMRKFDSFCLNHYPMLILTRGRTVHEMPQVPG
jgi:hypothetical protein